MTNQKFSICLVNWSGSLKPALTQFHMNMAASIQAVTEKIVLTITRILSTNSVWTICAWPVVSHLIVLPTEKFLRDSGFKNIWIQPAAGDAGGALGPRLLYGIMSLATRENLTGTTQCRAPYLGPEFSDEQIEQTLVEMGLYLPKRSREELIKQTALALTGKQVGGLVPGENGVRPQSFGTRSILADPRSGNRSKRTQPENQVS